MRSQVDLMNWPRPVAVELGFFARALPPLSTWMIRLTSNSTAEPSDPAVLADAGAAAASGAAPATALPSGSTATPFW